MVAIVKDILAGFYTTMKGMAITGIELFRPAITVQYPKETRHVPDRFRGTLVNDVTTCIACNKCSRVCPVDCFEITAVGKGKERKPSYFSIDYIKCCWCELCVDVCPTVCLYMSKEHELVYTDRSLMIRDFVSDPVPPKEGNKEPETEEKVDKKSEEEKPESGSAAA